MTSHAPDIREVAVDRPRVTPLWLSAVAAWVVSRTISVAAAALAAHRHPGTSLTRVLSSWDGQWYLSIARSGYPDHLPMSRGRALQSSVGFFPGYPGVVRAVHAVSPFSLPVTAVVVSLLLALPAIYLFGVLVGRWWGPAAATRATWVFALFPGSLVLSMVYAESLMLTAAIGCVILLKDRRWVLAGLAGAVATATRPNAVEICFACAWAAGVAIHRRRDWSALLAPVLSVLGIVGYVGYIGARTGHADAWTRVEHDGWHLSNDFGQHYLDRMVQTITWRSQTLDDVILFASSLLALVLLVWLVRLHPPGVILVTALSGVALMVSDINGAIPRYLLGIFPLLIPPAVKLRGPARAVWLVVSGVGLALLVVHTYGNFASGRPVLLTP